MTTERPVGSARNTLNDRPVVLVELGAVLEVGRLQAANIGLDLIGRRRFARVALDRTCRTTRAAIFLLPVWDGDVIAATPTIFQRYA